MRADVAEREAARVRAPLDLHAAHVAKIHELEVELLATQHRLRALERGLEAVRNRRSPAVILIAFIAVTSVIALGVAGTLALRTLTERVERELETTTPAATDEIGAAMSTSGTGTPSGG